MSTKLFIAGILELILNISMQKDYLKIEIFI